MDSSPEISELQEASPAPALDSPPHPPPKKKMNDSEEKNGGHEPRILKFIMMIAIIWFLHFIRPCDCDCSSSSSSNGVIMDSNNSPGKISNGHLIVLSPDQLHPCIVGYEMYKETKRECFTDIKKIDPKETKLAIKAFSMIYGGGLPDCISYRDPYETTSSSTSSEKKSKCFYASDRPIMNELIKMYTDVTEKRSKVK